MADKNDRPSQSPGTAAERRRQKREAKEQKARERRIARRSGDKRLFPKPSRRASVAFIAVVAVLFALSVFWRLGPGSAPTKPQAQTKDAPAVAASGTTMIYKAGSYTVGKNLHAGEYKLLSAGKEAPATVTVDGSVAASFSTSCWLSFADGQQVSVDGATFVAADDVSATDAQELRSGGTYKIGTDGPAGRYAVTAEGDDASFAVADDDAAGSHAADTSVHGSVEVDLAAGQFLTLNGCVATVLG